MKGLGVLNLCAATQGPYSSFQAVVNPAPPGPQKGTSQWGHPSCCRTNPETLPMTPLLRSHQVTSGEGQELTWSHPAWHWAGGGGGSLFLEANSLEHCVRLPFAPRALISEVAPLGGAARALARSLIEDDHGSSVTFSSLVRPIPSRNVLVFRSPYLCRPLEKVPG